MINFDLQQDVVQLAVKSLIYEVVATPKPGLVDPVSAHSHPDMDVFLFITSALSLEPYFQACYSAGNAYSVGKPLSQLFEVIRPLGIEAEHTMFEATQGINTHKGAIFSMGITLAALGYLKKSEQVITTTGIQTVIQKMLMHLLDQDWAQLKAKESTSWTAGERQFMQSGLTGIRGEAAQGFPAVFKHGLPCLAATKGTTNVRILTVLMVIAQHISDSTLVKRAQTPEIIPEVQAKIKLWREAGGLSTPEGRQLYQKLNQDFDERRLSLGGAADLVILTLFLGLLSHLVE